MIRNSSDAEDLVQDTLIRAFTGFSGYQHGNLHTWLMTIVTNTAINTHRSRQRRPTEVLTADLPESPTMRHGASSHWRSPEKCLLESVPSDRTQTALRQLPNAGQVVLYYADVEGLRYSGIADILGVPVGTVCHASIAHASAFATYSPPQDSPHPPTCHATQRAWLLADNVLPAISPGLWVVGFEKYLELNAVGVLKCQYRNVFALGDR